MIHDLKPYPAYKDSGVPWLGEVPEHWEVKRNKLFMKEINERSADGSEELLTVSKYTGVTKRRDKISEEGKLLTNAASLVGYKNVNNGDLVINIMLAWNGSLGASPVEGIVSPAYCVYRAEKNIEPRFVHYLFRTPLFTGVFKTVSTGVVDSRLRLYPEEFFRLQSLIPPLPEQTAIVRYLDHMDRRIRRYIHTKQKLIKLLEEQKQAIIHRAVTRGLDPDVKLKDSGVEWLDEVPEYWETIQLTRVLFSIEQGWSPVASEDKVQEEQWAVLTLSSVKKGKFYPQENKPLALSLEIPPNLEVKNEDFLLTRSNTRNLVGDVCVVEETREKLMLCDLIYRLRLDTNKLNPHFLMYQLLSPTGRRQIEGDARGSSSTMVKISQGHIKGWNILLPSLNEQVEIVNYLTNKCSSIDFVVNQAEQEINLIKEYRTRLISDVVTGKLDVREAAANLPEGTG